jgi:hypothetical protein
MMTSTAGRYENFTTEKCSNFFSSISNKLLQILILMCRRRRRRRRRRNSGVAAAAAAAQSLRVHLNQSLKPLLFNDEEEEEAEDQKGKMI